MQWLLSKYLGSHFDAQGGGGGVQGLGSQHRLHGGGGGGQGLGSQHRVHGGGQGSQQQLSRSQQQLESKKAKAIIEAKPNIVFIKTPVFGRSMLTWELLEEIHDLLRHLPIIIG